MYGTSAMVSLGVASIGSVAGFIVANRTLRVPPAHLRATLRFLAWALVLVTGIVADVLIIAGSTTLPWLFAGMLAGCLAHQVIIRGCS